MTYTSEGWCERLGHALSQLVSIQEPFLEAYWRANSYPPQVSFNGVDETPFPKQDIVELLDSARKASRPAEEKFYGPLREALASVEVILRSHSSLKKALGSSIEKDAFHIVILSGTSFTWLTRIVAGLLERAHGHGTGGFFKASLELKALLDLSSGGSAIAVPNDLNLGYDILLFHGPEIREEFELQEGLIVKPASALLEYLDRQRLQEYVPDEMKRRDWRQIGAVVRPFHWRPAIRSPSDYRAEHPCWPPRFEDDALAFLGLLSIANQTPIIPFMLTHGCVHRSAHGLLGLAHNQGGSQPILQVGRRHDPFRAPPTLQNSSVELARQAHRRRENDEYKRLEPAIVRLSEALARIGRFTANDRILDVSQSLELMFRPKGRGTSRQLQDGMADLLGVDEGHKNEIRSAIKQFYDVRSAIVHGAIEARHKRKLESRRSSFKSGFNLAQQALFKMLLSDKNAGN